MSLIQLGVERDLSATDVAHITKYKHYCSVHVKLQCENRQVVAGGFDRVCANKALGQNGFTSEQVIRRKSRFGWLVVYGNTVYQTACSPKTS